ncbi:MAG: PP2C family protein-serine/threonine phosphatase, partial [Nitrospirales bacterium]|nr:PP2C family protein-serine/threonine phosphatase [Nitrospirales bacterium]
TAGHPGGVLVRSNGNSLVLGARTWPIGFMPNESYATQSLTLQSGDRLYLFSDGVFEVMNPQGDIWGVERLRMTMEKTAGQSMSIGLKDIIQESQRWQVHATFGDDVALVGLEFLLDAIS